MITASKHKKKGFMQKKNFSYDFFFQINPQTQKFTGQTLI